MIGTVINLAFYLVETAVLLPFRIARSWIRTIFLAFRVARFAFSVFSTATKLVFSIPVVLILFAITAFLLYRLVDSSIATRTRKSMAQKTILITEATSEFGRELALEFGKTGAYLILCTLMPIFLYC